MIYFLCALLFLVVAFGKSNHPNGYFALVIVVVSLLLAIMRVGGYV